MKNKVFLIYTISFLTTFHANQIAASESDRVSRMKATIDELSFRVGELKTENQRLEAALRAAIASSRAGKRIAVGCDVENAKDSFLYNTNEFSQASKLMSWMRLHGKQCSAVELKQLRRYANSLESFAGDSIVVAIDDLLIDL